MAKFSTIILAAGVGSRMKSHKPKVLHRICGKSMIARITEAALQVSDDVHIVLYHQKEVIEAHLCEYFGDKLESISLHTQDCQNFPGTGGALMEPSGNAENVKTSQNAKVESVFDDHAAGGRIFLKKHRLTPSGIPCFDEKVGLCSGEQGDKTCGLSTQRATNSPLFRKKPTPETQTPKPSKQMFSIKYDRLVVLNGDMPLITPESIAAIAHTQAPIVVSTITLENPSGYGRVQVDSSGQITQIIEEKDCDESQKSIKLVNAGIYGFDRELLERSLPRLSNDNAQQEYYLTDIIALARSGDSALRDKSLIASRARRLHTPSMRPCARSQSKDFSSQILESCPEMDKQTSAIPRILEEDKQAGREKSCSEQVAPENLQNPTAKQATAVQGEAAAGFFRIPRILEEDKQAGREKSCREQLQLESTFDNPATPQTQKMDSKGEAQTLSKPAQDSRSFTQNTPILNTPQAAANEDSRGEAQTLSKPAQDSRILELESGLFEPRKEIRLGRLSTQRGDEIHDSSPKAESTNDPNTLIAPFYGNPREFMGVNSKSELAQAESIRLQELRQRAMDQGVIMRLPESIYLEEWVEFEGECEIENNVRICGKSVIKHSHIKASSVVEDSVIEHSDIGPMAHIRPKSHISHTHIGNFVETKAAHLEGVKAGHLSYLGDCEIGAGSNVGAGVITCNYDGKGKHRTIIGQNVFIGSDCQLIAPVEIESNAIIGAGSTITTNVKSGELALSRTKQSNIAGFFHRFFANTKERQC